MKKLDAHFISADAGGPALLNIAGLLDQQPKQAISNLLWSSAANKPDASFVIAHTSDSLLLKFTVKEKHIRAVYRQTNDPVYKDTCVEAFIAFDDKGYYNLEFNCMGTALMAYGDDKENRVNINKGLVSLIQSHSTIKPQINSLIEWQLTLNIPFKVFNHHHISALNSRTVKMNFYKCGDELPEAHYLSWNNIDYPHPNFHLPQFFGDVRFTT